MTSDRHVRSWLKAIDAASSTQGIALPPFTEIAMGTAIARNRTGGRSVSYKRRLIPVTETRNDGAEWSFWLDQDDQKRTIVSFREPLIPTDQRVAIVLSLIEGWLLRDWPVERVQQVTETQITHAQRFDLAPGKAREFWLSDDRAFGVSIENDGWSMRSHARCLTSWRGQTDNVAGEALPLQSLDRLCLWLARHWLVLAYGSDVRPPGLLNLAVSASYAYESAQLLNPPASDSDVADWWKRHAFRAAQPDLPNIFMERQADELVISWDASPTNERFYNIPNGEVVLPVGVAVPILRNLVQARLESMGLNAPERLGLLKVISNTTQEGYSALTGYNSWVDDAWLDQHGFSDEYARQFAVAGTARHPIVGLLRTGQGTSITAKDFELVLSLLETSKVQSFQRLLAIAKGISPAIEAREPWESGYRLAALVRQKLGLTGSSPFDAETKIRDLGVNVFDTHLSDAEVVGACVGSPGFVPTIILNSRSPDASGPSGRRITLAHELCHLLFDRARMLSFARFEGAGADSDRLIEMRANAFAVELLVPMSILVRNGSVLTEEELTPVSIEHQVSLTALKRHAQNLRNRVSRR